MKTETSPWQIDHHRARLQTELLQAEVDLQHPSAGITNVVYGGVATDNARLLQVIPEPRSQDENRLVERYLRGDDVAATYAPVPPRTAVPGIYWRSIDRPGRVAGVELVVSVQTDRLDDDSRVSNRSDLRASEVWWLAGQNQTVFQQLPLSSLELWTTKGRDAAGAFLFRLADQESSYVEIMAPADFGIASLRRQDATPESVRLSYELFPEPIEKGVIRRVRVQGLMMPRKHDLDVARECRTRLLTAPLPLTT